MIVFDFRSFCSSFKNIFRSMNRSPAPIPMFNISTITFNRLYSIARRNSHGQSCPRFVSNRWSTNSTVKRLRKMKRVLELPDPCFEGVSYVFSSHCAWRIATYCLSNDLFEFSPPVTSHRIVDKIALVDINLYRSTYESNSIFRMDTINETRFRLKSDFLQKVRLICLFLFTE